MEDGISCTENLDTSCDSESANLFSDSRRQTSWIRIQRAFISTCREPTLLAVNVRTACWAWLLWQNGVFQYDTGCSGRQDGDQGPLSGTSASTGLDTLRPRRKASVSVQPGPYTLPLNWESARCRPLG